ncbi:UDP-glucuronic acid decarboxylase family protein [Cumulibacter soli]|uniref:UDP-glucuronic acid decarboxylase family protein n=1 Tax=Cumulibacter soli TaxID=2546344 RepID=UPI0010680445|nr:UDP-glucuronic acid decarboxylase family protein [Cumulibacter soli]
MRVVVTGGAGFIGSHLCRALIARGDSVVCVDDFSSGLGSNVLALADSDRFVLIEHDVRERIPVVGPVDAVVNLASLASPPAYLARPLFTLQTGSIGTQNALELAKRSGARFVQASTSEVYGDPEIHPQTENYWGNVNPIGPRSVYDEAKRYGEALVAAYTRDGLNGGIIRIFNTYGPRMRVDDGRVVTQFISQALANDPLTVYGDGSQTRSLCYVSDLVRGFIAMVDSEHPGPVNMGNPQELTVRQIADLVIKVTASASRVEFRELPQDDPQRRRPDISKAQSDLGWAPQVDVVEGLARTVEWIAAGAHRDAAVAVST